MSINGQNISSHMFAKIYTEMQVIIQKKQAQLSPNQYLSPSGLFLLIALYWFKQQKVDVYILETGRGAMFDEVGNIKSNISIITNILLEHPQFLGATINDIAIQKMYVATNSEHCVMEGNLKKHLSEHHKTTCHFVDHSEAYYSDYSHFAQFPKWYYRNFKLSLTAVKLFIKLHNNSNQNNKNSNANLQNHKWQKLNMEKIINNKNLCTSPSFGVGNYGEVVCYFEAAINTESIDNEFLKNLKKHTQITFIMSIPDDKNVAKMTDALKKIGKVKHVVLTGTRGYLNYKTTKQLYGNDILWQGQFNDENGFIKSIKSLLSNDFLKKPADEKTNVKQLKEKLQTSKKQPEILYFIGTQTYIRLVKKTLF